MPSEKEIRIIEKAAYYDLQRLLRRNEKEKKTYTVDELVTLMETLTDAKDQES